MTIKETIWAALLLGAVIHILLGFFFNWLHLFLEGRRLERERRMKVDNTLLAGNIHLEKMIKGDATNGNL